jgi:hypothetical protein
MRGPRDNVTRIAPRAGLRREYRGLLEQQLTGAIATAQALLRQQPTSPAAAKAHEHVERALAALQQSAFAEIETK